MNLLLLSLCFGADPAFGVDETRLDGHARYRLSGHLVPRARVLEAIGGPAWPDANRWRVSVVGEGRDAVLADFAKHAALAPWRDRCVVRGYDPAHWHLLPGFVTTGRPTIYVQTAEGVVLHRQDDYTGGADALALALAHALEAAETSRVRKPAPDYKPEADRDLRRRLLPGLRLPWSLYLGGAAIVLALLLCTWRKR